MKIQICDRFGVAKHVVEGDRVSFVTDDGDRIVFDLYVGRDGRSLELTGGGNYKIDGKIYTSALQLHPNASNSVTVRTVEWKD